jgi:uncharacterized protein (DUF1800 family)
MKAPFTVVSSSLRHRRAMADDRALIAHVLRRLTFGPAPGEVESYDGVAPIDVVRRLLDAAPLDPPLPELGTDDDYTLLMQWWVDVMSRPDAGLHEKMVWFWHGHLTSSFDKAEPAQMLRQHRLLRRLALGNFRELMQEITVDSAMLYWLDGSGSTAEAPNENYAREVMELFCLGRTSGAYTEADVRAGAIAFAGWWVDGDHGNEVRFDEESGPQGAVSLLGRRVSSASEAIDVICDHPACAPYIAGKLHTFFVGEAPSDDRRAELADMFMSSGLEIKPLVEAIVEHPSFMESVHNRPRSALEWFLAARRFYATEIDPWVLSLLGQVPFEPPNVAGWPGSERWLSAGATLTKAQTASDASWDTATLDDGDPVGAVLARAGLFDVSDESRAVLERAARSVDSRRDRSTVLHALVALSPEFSLA